MQTVTNTDYTILCAASRSAVTAFGLFGEWYRTSKQPGKKVAGIYRTLRSMHRRGWLRQLPGTSDPNTLFFLTDEGRRVGRAEKQRRDCMHAPVFPRLAV